VEPFKNFEHNRTFALQACENNPDIDYVLLMDADMVLMKGPEFNLDKFKDQLTIIDGVVDNVKVENNLFTQPKK
jgi:hypothetical protein